MLVKNHRKSFLSLLLIIIMTMGSILVNTGLANNKSVTGEHEYARITRERVESATKPGATKKEIKLAEGSLTALGWFVIYGNDSNSTALARTMAETVSNAYNGTDKMDVIYMNHTIEAYFEMLNLRRFENQKPENPSDEYYQLTRRRVEAALASGAGYKEFKLAEGSLCALGWLTLYGNDSNSDRLARIMMNLASNHWKGSNEVYRLQSSEAYGEMINLGRFKLNARNSGTNSANPSQNINLAYGKTATQSSNMGTPFAATDGLASKAVDGNTDGTFDNGSVTHTACGGQYESGECKGSSNPWWQVDLGAIYNVTKIQIWNRAEVPERLTNFQILVAGPGGTWEEFSPGMQIYRPGTQYPLTFQGNKQARYVRVQLRGNNVFLSLAEVKVFGTN
jgi:hypothetical protein